MNSDLEPEIIKRSKPLNCKILKPKKREEKKGRNLKTPTIVIQHQLATLKMELGDFEHMLETVQGELSKVSKDEAPELHRLMNENMIDFEASIKYCKEKIEFNEILLKDANLLQEHVNKKFVDKFKK